MEAAFRIVRAEASGEAFNKVMVEEVFPYLKEKYANHKRPWLMEKPPTGPDAGEVILKYIQNRQIKYSEGAEPLITNAVKLRDKGAEITMRKGVDFAPESGVKEVELAGSSNLEDVIKHLNTYTFKPLLGPRLTRAFYSVFEEAKVDTFWHPENPKVTIEDVEKIVGRKLNQTEFQKFLEAGFQKNCCLTGRCPSCKNLCALDGSNIHISNRAKFEELPGVLYQILNGERMASIEWGVNQRAIIRAFQESTNVFDMAHELGHLFRRSLKPEDLKIAEEWAGVDHIDSPGHWHVDAEERFARAFEEYLAKGEASTPQAGATVRNV